MTRFMSYDFLFSQFFSSRFSLFPTAWCFRLDFHIALLSFGFLIFYFFSLIHIVNSSRSASFQTITVFTSLSLSGSRHTMVHVLVTAFFFPSHQLLVKPHITPYYLQDRPHLSSDRYPAFAFACIHNPLILPF